MSTNPWIWVSAVLTLFIFSYLYKENPFFRFAEHLFTGLTVGYAIPFYWNNYVQDYFIQPLFANHRYIILIPFAIGLLYLTRFIPKIGYLMLIPIAIALGVGNGMSLPLIVEADLLKQIQGTMLTAEMLNKPWDPYNGLVIGILILIGVVCTISYFYFSREHKGALKISANIGIWFVMIGFGASFGYTVMARVSLLIGRLQFLFTDWIHLIK
ncbi:MAG: hypothetical protein QME74_07300 [Candidatus Edwardsbacteria bacterium]|nr:hypothetical protein [Candidatus Edwardsbacteria bacterium]